VQTRAETIKAAGHAAHLEQPEATVRVVEEFLKASARPARPVQT